MLHVRFLVITFAFLSVNVPMLRAEVSPDLFRLGA